VQKLLHKLIVVICIICFSVISPVAYSALGIPVVQESADINLTEDSINVKDIDIDPINTEQVKKNVVPDTKNEFKKLIGLFIKAMIMVVFSAVVIYIVVLFVRKYFGSEFAPQADEEEYDNLELTTPEDKISALKSFLNRTK